MQSPGASSSNGNEGAIPFSETIRQVLRLDPPAGAIEFEGEWHSWSELDTILQGVDQALTRADVGPDAAVGALLRNDPSLVGALLGILTTGRCVVTINPHQGDKKLARDLRDLRVGAVVAHRDDWQREGVKAAAAAAGSLGLAISADTVAPIQGLEEQGRGPHRGPFPGVAVEMLTSGTTGTPKRVQLGYRALDQSLSSAAHYEKGKGRKRAPALRRGIAVISAPLVHIGGLWRTLQCVADGRRIALMERFGVPEWVDLVRRHRPRTVSLVPAALRMVLDANVAPQDLSSLQAVVSGTAPLPPATAVAFEERYGIPVLVSYGATEFAGGVAGWNLADHRKWGGSKRGSVGRAHPGCALRVINPDTGRVLPPGEQGLLEVKSAQLGAGSGWVRTTDIAAIDADGFLWIKGRADNAIIRGGFKISPAEVAAVLKAHPSVREAAVVALPDARLGQVPVAAVELEDGAPPVDGERLRAYARDHLTRYQVPGEIRVVDKLPRTPSLKISEPEVKAIFEHGR